MGAGWMDCEKIDRWVNDDDGLRVEEVAEVWEMNERMVISGRGRRGSGKNANLITSRYQRV